MTGWFTLLIVPNFSIVISLVSFAKHFVSFLSICISGFPQSNLFMVINCRNCCMQQNTWENQFEETCKVRVAVLKTEQRSTRSQCNFFCIGVILVYLLVFDTILAALFFMHFNLRKFNLAHLALCYSLVGKYLQLVNYTYL